MKTKVVEVWCTLVMSAVLTGCADHDFDWENARCENPEYNYIYGFEQMYGAIDPDQSWDFSAGGRIASTRAGETTTQIIDGLDFGIVNTATKDGITSTINTNNALYDDVAIALPDGKTHTGKAVVLTAPGNPFTIYPISCQGGWTHELYVKVGNDPAVKVYDKDWTDYSKPYVNGMGTAKAESTTTNYVGTWVDMAGQTTDKKIYKLENNATAREKYNTSDTQKWALSGTSLVKENDGSYYAVIKRNSDNALVLFSISLKAFLRINNSGGLTTTVNIAEASVINATNDGQLKIGNKYLYHYSQKVNWKGNPDNSGRTLSYGLKLADSFDQNSDNYKWTWQSTNAGNTQKNTINEKIGSTTSGYVVTKVAQMNGITINAPVGTPIQIYVKASGNGENLAGTATGNVIYVAQNSTTRPVNVPSTILTDESVIKYVGIEDQLNDSKDGPGGDKDFNDLTLCIIGSPNVPQEIEIKSNEYDVPVTYDKRYLVEDMGFAMPGSDAVKFGYTDIDFNDIVIDFSYTVTTHHVVTKTNGVITSDVTTTSTSPTTATIRALGGTWDFVLSLKNSDNNLTPLFWKKESRKVARTEREVGIDLPAIVPNKYYPLWSEETSDGEVTENFEKFNVGTIYNTGLSSTTRGDNHHVMVAGKKTQGQNLIDQTGWDESWLCKIENVSGWDYNANNLVFTLIDSQADEWHLHDLLDSNTDAYNVYFKTNPDYQFAFPAIGACPKIVAFDTNKQWKIERNPVDKAWFERTTMSTTNIPYDYDYSSGSSDD